uniref:Phosphatidylinositol-glycan biosynthesis class X protein n=1 Tax=Megaselia scalaris TaxID=36166 RepID=T1GG37_MEGSC
MRQVLLILCSLSAVLAFAEGFDFKKQCTYYNNKTEQIISTFNETSVILSVEVEKSATESLNLTINYKDNTTDTLKIFSLKPTVFKFYNFTIIEIQHSENARFCINYELSSYKVPSPKIIVPLKPRYTVSEDDITKYIILKENTAFNRSDMELEMCKHFNKILPKNLELCKDNESINVFLDDDCPYFWPNSSNCHQFTFRILIEEKVYPTVENIDSYMNTSISARERYWNSTELEIFWSDFVIATKDINEYQRQSPSE